MPRRNGPQLGRISPLPPPPAPGASLPCQQDGRNSVGFYPTDCLGAWPPEVLAVTLGWFNADSGHIGEMDVLFNVHESWDTYAGSPRPAGVDFHRVALHELGHVLGLDHPNDHGQTVAAIMNSRPNRERLQPDDRAGIRAIYGSRITSRPKGALENPGADAFKSGIGIISGWICAATQVEVDIDGRYRFPVVYGTDRGDTQGTCGDTNNGFVTLVNWNILGPGVHTLRLLADGVEVTRSRFTVTTFGKEFLHETTSPYEWYQVPDFPRPGVSTFIQWEKSSQNFTIIGVE